jgi:hypothetical protein
VKSLAARQERWERELNLATSGKHWREFAAELRACAEFLDGCFQAAVTGRGLPPGVTLRAFFAPKFCRMLMGFCLENLTKGLLLAGPNKAKYIRRGKISFERKGHDLLWLLGEAGLCVDEETEFFIAGWSISAEWFGKYPYPLDMNQLLDEYVPMPSSEALSRRLLRGKREWTHHDLLHGQIGSAEWTSFRSVYDMLNAHDAA